MTTTPIKSSSKNDLMNLIHHLLKVVLEISVPEG